MLGYVRRLIEAWEGERADYVSAATLAVVQEQALKEWHEWQSVVGDDKGYPSMAWPMGRGR